MGYELLPEADGAGASSSGGSGATGGAGKAGGGASSQSGSDAGGASDGGESNAGGEPSSGGSSGTAAGTAGSSGSGGGPMGPLTLAPSPSFTVTPGATEPGELFSVDATATTDSEDSLLDLTFDWDLDNNGTYDATGVAGTHSFASPGVYTITLRVTDRSGASATTSRVVVVAAAGDLVIVNTDSTTTTAGATPASPGPDGLLSIGEAAAYVNGTAGAQVILVEPGLNIPLTGTVMLDDPAGDSLVGYGASVGGVGTCIGAASNGGVVAGLTITNCSTRGISVLADDVTVANCTITGGNVGLYVDGSLGGVTIGPGNALTNIGNYGLHLSGPATVIGNRIADTGSSGILVLGGANGSAIRQNQVIRSGQFNIDLANQVTGLIISHNLFHGSAVHAIGLGGTSGASFENNTVTGATSWGIPINPGGFSPFANNLFFGNGNGGCNCSLDASNLEVDPLYVNQSADDFRPGLLSPLLDAGVDTGFDTNGFGPGLFNGLGPDIGYSEAPSP